MRPRLVGPLIVQQTSKLFEAADALQVSREHVVRYDPELGQPILKAKNGYIYVGELSWFAYVTARSKRHWSSVKRQLPFLELVRNGEDCGELRFRRPPEGDQDAILRKVLGWKKRPKSLQKPLWD
jgi:hypothetical protein